MIKSYNMLAWSLTGDRPLFRALLLLVQFKKKSKIMLWYQLIELGVNVRI